MKHLVLVWLQRKCAFDNCILIRSTLFVCSEVDSGRRQNSVKIFKHYFQCKFTVPHTWFQVRVHESKRFISDAGHQEVSVALEVNLRNPLHASDESCKWGICSGLETEGQYHQMTKTVAPQKRLMCSKKFFRKIHCWLQDVLMEDILKRTEYLKTTWNAKSEWSSCQVHVSWIVFSKAMNS